MYFFPVKPKIIAFRSQGINFSLGPTSQKHIYSTRELGQLLECDRTTLNYDIQQIIYREIYLNVIYLYS
jgi:hypothetical protein